MSDWSEPIATTLYTGVLTALDDRLDELSKMFDGQSPTNLPTGAYRIDGTSNNALQTWNGTSWDDEELSVKRLTIGSNLVASETDLRLTGNANIATDGDLNLYIDSNNDQTDKKFNWYKNSGDTTGASLLMSLSEAGALVLNGTLAVNSGAVVNLLDLNADTGFDTQIRFRENAITRGQIMYDESGDNFRLIKYDTNGTTIKADFRLNNTGLINAVIGTLQQAGNNILHAGGGQEIAADFAAGALGFRIRDIGTNAEMEFIPDCAAGTLNPKALADDFGLFFSDSAIDLAKGIIGVWGGAGAPAIRFDAVTKTIVLTASGGFAVENSLDIEAYSEDGDSYTVTTGTKTLDLSGATYFYASAVMTAVAYTFAFSNPAPTGRVSSFTVRMRNAGLATSITWPAGVDWGPAGEPVWTSSGDSFVAFVTQDGSAATPTYYAFVGRV